LLALARRALTLVPAVQRTRLSRGVTAVAASEVMQMRLGEASAMIDAATTLMHTHRSKAVEMVEAGLPIAAIDVARARRDVSLIAQLVRQGVEMLAETAGSQYVYDVDPLQALLRDVQTIATHIVVARQPAMVPYGRLLLGLPTAESL
jgi:hypothetical protein